MNIVIERNPASKKYCEKAEIRSMGKAGRLARMFAKSRQKKKSKRENLTELRPHL